MGNYMGNLGTISTVDPVRILSAGQSLGKPIDENIVGHEQQQVESHDSTMADAQARRTDDDNQKQIRAFKDMMANPQAARQIAQQYGLPYDPSLDSILQDRQKSQMVLEGAQMASKLGIRDPKVSGDFISNYVQSGGDFQSALSNTQNVQGSNARAQSGRQQLPRGYRYGADGQTAERIPGLPPERTAKATEWYDDQRVPPLLRAKAKGILRSYDPLISEKPLQAVYDQAQAYLKDPAPQAAPQGGSSAPEPDYLGHPGDPADGIVDDMNSDALPDNLPYNTDQQPGSATNGGARSMIPPIPQHPSDWKYEGFNSQTGRHRFLLPDGRQQEAAPKQTNG